MMTKRKIQEVERSLRSPLNGCEKYKEIMNDLFTKDQVDEILKFIEDSQDTLKQCIKQKIGKGMKYILKYQKTISDECSSLLISSQIQNCLDNGCLDKPGIRFSIECNRKTLLTMESDNGQSLDLGEVDQLINLTKYILWRWNDNENNF